MHYGPNCELTVVAHPLPGYACLPTPIASRLLRTLPYFLILSEQISKHHPSCSCLKKAQRKLVCPAKVVIGLCIYFRLGEFASSRSRLARTFSRDGLYYFFAISCTSPGFSQTNFMLIPDKVMSVANVSFSMAFLVSRHLPIYSCILADFFQNKYDHYLGP